MREAWRSYHGIEVTQRVNDKISCSGEWLPLISFEKIHADISFAAFCRIIIYIYYFCRGFRLSKPLLQITALKAQSVSLISTGHLLRCTDHSILAYSILLSFYCHTASCIKTCVNLRRGMLARSRGGKFNGHLLRAHPERSVLLSIPL